MIILDGIINMVTAVELKKITFFLVQFIGANGREK